MRCPRCGNDDTRVVDSRVSKDADAIRRRRECAECEARFTTFERVERAVPSIVKSDGRREAFDREKVRRGIDSACQKRPVSAAKRARLVDHVEGRLAETLEREVPSRMIGDMVMEELRRLDGVAWLRFASVYRSFEDIGEFLNEVEREQSKDDDE